MGFTPFNQVVLFWLDTGELIIFIVLTWMLLLFNVNTFKADKQNGEPETVPIWIIWPTQTQKGNTIINWKFWGQKDVVSNEHKAFLSEMKCSVIMACNHGNHNLLTAEKRAKILTKQRDCPIKNYVSHNRSLPAAPFRLTQTRSWNNAAAFYDNIRLK